MQLVTTGSRLQKNEVRALSHSISNVNLGKPFLSKKKNTWKTIKIGRLDHIKMKNFFMHKTQIWQTKK